MKADRLSREQLLQEVNRLNRNLKRRIDTLEGLGNQVPQYAINDYRELERTLPRRFSDLSDTDLRTLHRELKYIDNLKTSRVAGARQVESTFSPIMDKLKSLSQETQRKFWEVYEMLYEKTSGTLEQYKYDIFGTTIDAMMQGTSPESLPLKIEEIYRDTRKELGRETDEDDVRVLFTSKLRSILG